MKSAALLGLLSGAVSLLACEPQEPNYVVEEDSGAATGSTGGGAGSGVGETGGAAGTPVTSGGGTAGDATGSGGSAGALGAAGSPVDAAPAQDAAKGEGGGVDVTHTAMFHGSPGGTAVFTQHGIDVTVTVKLTNCSMGNHPIFIYEGFACDSTATEGNKWDGGRANLADTAVASVIACKADKTGLLTYMRPGSDMATRWTVSDHNLLYDVTNRVIVVSDVNNEATRQSCADFR